MKRVGKPKKEKQHPYKGMLRDYSEFLLWGMAIFLFFNCYVAQNFKIPTSSMENTLLIGDHITLNTFIFTQPDTALERSLLPVREIKRGDVVVFKYPGDTRQKWVKRCIATPGQTFEIKRDYLYIDGEGLDEPYPFYKGNSGTERDPENRYRPGDYNELEPGLENANGRVYENLSLRQIVALTERNLAPFKRLDPYFFGRVKARLDRFDGETIPPGFYLMMGDNRNYSVDSRRWGLVPRELIEGRPYWVWWSYGEDEGTHLDKGLAFVWNYLRIPFTLFTRTHWSDCFKRIR